MNLKFNLFKNQYKKTENQPVYKGQVKNAEGDHIGDVSCWIKKDKNGNDYLSCNIGKPYKDIQSAPQDDLAGFNTDDGLPF